MSRHLVPHPSDTMRLVALEKDVRTLLAMAYFNMVLTAGVALMTVLALQ